MWLRNIKIMENEIKSLNKEQKKNLDRITDAQKRV